MAERVFQTLVARHCSLRICWRHWWNRNIMLVLLVINMASKREL